MVTIKESGVKKGFSIIQTRKEEKRKLFVGGVDHFKIKGTGLSSIRNRGINIQPLENLEELWYHLQPVPHTFSFCLKGFCLS